MWRPATIDPDQAERMHELRAKHNITPLVIHTSYLVNVCSQTEEVREKSVACFRREIERALTFGADYLVLHPGSWKGLSRHEGLQTRRRIHRARHRRTSLAEHQLHASSSRTPPAPSVR